MSALISSDDAVSGRGAGPCALCVRGVRYANTAAQFWGGLIDEVVAAFPTCSLVELSAPSSTPLEHDLLFPARSLAQSVESLWHADLERVMRETVAEIELLGPPPSVSLRLLHGTEELAARALPTDCVDAETFPFLLVWPLEWAGVPARLWNGELVAGEFTADDRQRAIRYDVMFDVRCRHVAEGLLTRSISVTPSVCPIRS